jgi:DNA polymerase III delta prime subunit
MIAEAENVQMDDEVGQYCLYRIRVRIVNREKSSFKQVVPLILELSGGDMRKAITFMQTGQRLHSAQTPPTPITADSSKSM